MHVSSYQGSGALAHCRIATKVLSHRPCWDPVGLCKQELAAMLVAEEQRENKESTTAQANSSAFVPNLLAGVRDYFWTLPHLVPKDPRMLLFFAFCLAHPRLP